jgi:hypothetical protein
MVKQIPVERRMIDKRGYYRKGDIEAWLVEDMASADSLARKLRAQHAESLKRISKEPSRRYRSGQLDKEAEVQAKTANAALVWPTPTKDELSGGWSKGLARRRNAPIPDARPLSEAEAKAADDTCEWVRKELKGVAR